MSKRSLDAFRAKIAEDETLRREVSRAFGGGDGRAVTSADRLVAFAKAHGYDFSAEELRESVELTDKDLDAVAGGALSLSGTAGESTDDKHKDQIELLSWSWTTTLG